MKSIINHRSIKRAAFVATLLTLFLWCFCAVNSFAQVKDTTSVEITYVDQESVVDGATVPVATDNTGTTIDIPDPLPDAPAAPFDVDEVLNWEQLLYAALLVLFTWLSYLIPGLNVHPIRIRAVAVAVLLIGLFVLIRVGSNQDVTIVQLLTFLINYTITTGLYDRVFKPLFGGSPKTSADEAIEIEKLKALSDQLKKVA